MATWSSSCSAADHCGRDDQRHHARQAMRDDSNRPVPTARYSTPRTPRAMSELLHRQVDPRGKRDVCARGIAASPGAATGKIVFTSRSAQAAAAREEPCILVRRETTPEDIRGMHASVGVLTERGGMTSHAAVVARGMGRPCVSGAGALRIDYKAETMTVGNATFNKGDVITVDGITGTVSRIRIRATTIRNWDGQELLVPNKEFITGRLLNWTLSDPTTRIVIPVGLVYGGDVSKAMALMLEAAREHPEVLADPAPSVIFDEFGDNALSLKLRCFVPSMENRIFVFSALHEAINRKFNDAGLVIAFPQRDVHLDTSQPLDIRVHRGTGGQPDAV